MNSAVASLSVEQLRQRETALRRVVTRWNGIDHMLAGGKLHSLPHATQEQMTDVLIVNRQLLAGQPSISRDEAEAELEEIERLLPDAEALEARERDEHEESVRAEQERRLRTALERATGAAETCEHANAELDALLSAELVARIMDVAAARRAAAATFQAALGLLGNVAIGGRLNDAQQVLLEQLGPRADAVRRALPDGHPAQREAPPVLNAYLPRHWLVQEIFHRVSVQAWQLEAKSRL